MSDERRKAYNFRYRPSLIARVDAEAKRRSTDRTALFEQAVEALLDGRIVDHRPSRTDAFRAATNRKR